MWLITHLPCFFFFNSFIFMLDGKEEKEEQSRSRKIRAKEEVLGWEACTAVVACFIYIIVQAGLRVLQRCFVCHSLQPCGYRGLDFPMINIQRDSHLEPQPVLPGFSFLYIYLVFFYFIYLSSLLFSFSSIHMFFVIMM